MHALSIPLSQGLGTSSFESLPKTLPATSPLPAESRSRSDDVRLSNQAAATVWNVPVAIAAFDRSAGNGLLTAARDVHQFLTDHPSVANATFGKSSALLIRATLQLEKNGGLDTVPEESRAQIARAIDQAETFLAEHPRVADSPLGASVAEMAKAIAAAIGSVDAGNQPQLADWLLEAARRADLYLDEYPTLASMPLGEAVSKLIDGVKALAEGNPLDADLQTLAKRVGYFLQNHPRLAQSEFGQLVSPLGRGIAAIDVSAGPAAEPPAGEALTEAAKTAVVLDVKPEAFRESGEETEVRRAA